MYKHEKFCAGWECVIETITEDEIKPILVKKNPA